MALPIISKIRSLIPGGPVYVRISSKALILRDSADGTELSIDPVLFVYGDGSKKRYALNSNVESLGDVRGASKRINGFKHPRTVLSDFIVAEQTLKLALRELFKDRRVAPNPILVLHPVEKTEGGLTWIERRAFMELGEGVGGRRVHVWEGRVLTDTELQSGTVFDEQRYTDA